jgi:hypothetical protein
MGRRFAWMFWIGGATAATVMIALRLQSTDRSLFLPGETTSGHHQIELSCDSCHTPYWGVRSEACLKCHEQELRTAEDSHPKSKFTDPRNADRIARLDATSCVTCHVEHRPEMTSAMGVTLPADYCFYCHSDVAKERPSHKDMAFDSCASAGCHNFHDNRALYADFLFKHRAEPDVLDFPIVMRRSKTAVTGAAHADAGVNCSGCHDVADTSGKKKWTDHPGYQTCQTCHKNEADGFLSGKHGMRLAAALAPMSPGIARLPMNSGARQHTLGCGSCHSAHVFDTRHAAVDACLGCHADDHSLGYGASRHFELWRAEIRGDAPAGSGISCATCHMPRLAVDGETGKGVRVQHNQNANLRPSEKMIREVCMNCHGLSFSIDALADSRLVEANFRGRPSRHVESIDMAVKKTSRQP